MSSEHSPLSWAFGIALFVHGLVHLMGVALLLELGEPGDLTYAAARPRPGTTLALLFAGMWALGAILFILAGYQVIRQQSWVPTVVAASIVSLIAIGTMAESAPIGLLISALTLVVGLWFSSRHRLSPR